MRTTIDIDDPVLEELKTVKKREHKSLSRMVSELLAVGLSVRNTEQQKKSAGAWKWKSKPMKMLVDAADREAVYDAMDDEVR